MTKFLDAARDNESATYSEETRAWSFLEAVDRVWERWKEAPSQPELMVSAWLRARCRGAYWGSIRLVAGGQPVEAIGLARSVLEHACYAVQAAWTPGAADAWMDRMSSPQCRGASRRHFGWTAVVETLESREPDLAAEVKSLYEDLIDQGAHPNSDASFGSMRIERDAPPNTMQFNVALIVPRGPLLSLGVTQVFRAGVLAHEMFGRIWPAEFAGRIQDLVRNIRLP